MMKHLLDTPTIESIRDKASDILETIGVEFETEKARQLLKNHGAKLEGKRVVISADLVEKALDSLPKVEDRAGNGRQLMASSPFGNAPMILDDMTGNGRRGTIQDAVKMYRLAETSELYTSANPSVVDPEGNDSEDPFIGQVALMLKYSDRWPSLGLRATHSNTKNGDVYSSAKAAIRLIREIKEEEFSPVMAQGICPMAPLSYDEEALINLEVLVDEQQEITIIPCTLTFMTGPESLMGIVIHDIAICLAGAVYVQLLRPGTPLKFSNSSTMTDMRTLQPAYGSPEYLNVQIMFHEVCRHFHMDSSLGGCFSDGTKSDYQGGFESCMTALAPFFMTSANKIWCSPGHMAAFAGASFKKMILDEEMIQACNRLLQGLDLAIDPQLKEKLKKGMEAKSFLTVGSSEIYRKEQQVSRIFDRSGISPQGSDPKTILEKRVSDEIEARLARYRLPERTKTQKKLLQQYLPTSCRY
ncbi:MAG: hypothetical protein D3926_00035 [Desulfobacteraceae bacterium]|nr:MAG: hypothetical protein D3926_00035 [Desulfobacteraceae bacterium]